MPYYFKYNNVKKHVHKLPNGVIVFSHVKIKKAKLIIKKIPHLCVIAGDLIQISL